MAIRQFVPKSWRELHGNSFERTRVLITGGAGFIGSHLAEALVDLGASVVIIDDLSGGRRENLDSFGPVDFVETSILDRTELSRSMRDCRYVFHLAALGSVPRSVKEPCLYYEVNVLGTLNVMECARELGVQRVIFAASSSAYGDNDVPWIESMPVRPQSPYAATKVAGEAMLRAYASSYKLDSVCPRYFNIFGPRQNASSAYAAVIAAFAKAALSGQSPVVYGDGEQTRDFAFVDNAVHATLLAARCERWLSGEAINVGCGNQISVNKLIAMMFQILGVSGLKPTHAPERVGDLKHSFADLRRAAELIGYTPIVEFAEGLKETLAWYRQC